MKIKNFFVKILELFKKIFLTGLFAILPLTITIVILHLFFNILTRWLQPLKRLEPAFLQKIPGIEIVIIILLLFLIGLAVDYLIIIPVMHHFEKVIRKIPFIKTVYSAAKTSVDFFNYPTPSKAAQQVVLVEFPTKGTYSIAFQLESAENNYQKLIPTQNSQSQDKKFYKIFMPTAPNPTTGFFLIIPEDQIIPTDITFEEAIKCIVSFGLITPESIKDKKE